MSEKIPTSRLIKYFLKGTVLSVLVFFSVSFLTYIADLSTFNPLITNPQNTVDIGFPFAYYQEFYFPGNRFPSTWASLLMLMIDCAITWLCVALPYVLIKIRKERKSQKATPADILDQK